MDQLRHAYIVSGEGSLDRALEIARSVVQSDKRQHPDIKIIYREKTELTVGQVRDVVSDSVVLPNESQFKVYIFADGDYMNTAAQNAALKLLEEPPAHVILILCSSKADVFLPTVRSRCTEIHASGSTEHDYSLAEDFLKSLSGNIQDRIAWLEGNNKISIPECRQFCTDICTVISEILCKRHDSYGLDSDTLLSLEKEIERCLKYLSVNVSVKQIFGLLEIF